MQKKIRLSIATALLVTTSGYGQLVEDLGMITVTSATKSEQSIKDVTSNVEVITGAELEEKHITTVLDALRLGGISIAQSGGIGQQSSFFLNGFKSGHTLVLIDGIKYNDPTTTEGQAQLEHLMISDIAQIEIIKGAQSGIWGANAVAGVINIITKKATKELITNVNIEFGSNNTKKTGANISQKVEKFSYFLGANYISTDGISAQTPRGKSSEDYEADGYTNKTLNGKFGYEITDNDAVKFNITDINAKVEYDPSGERNEIDNEVTQKNRLYKLDLQHNFNDKSYLQTSYAKTNFNKEDPLGYTTKFKGNNQEISLDGKVAYSLDSFLLLGTISQKSEDEIKNKEIKSTGYYLTNSNIFDKLILTESLRFDKYDLFDDATTGKIGAKYNFAQDFSLSGNYGTAYKVPVLSQIWYNATSNLQPETTKSSDITLEIKNLKATYFESVTTNLIEWKDPTPYSATSDHRGDTPPGTDNNTYGDDYYNNISGKSKFKGYEISYNNEILNHLLLTIIYNKQSAKDKDGKDLIRRIKESAKFNLDFYGIEKLHLGLYTQYIGKREDLGQVQTGKYTLVNTVANYDVSKNLKSYLKIDNLTDKFYQEVDGYGTMGRTFTVGINATF